MPTPFGWTRDEVLVVLDAVDRAGWRGIRASSREAVALSQLLNAAQIHSPEARPDDFRSPGSVQRKSEDIRTAHPNYEGTPTRGGATTRQLVAEWLAATPVLRAQARLVRALMETGEPVPDDQAEDVAVGEGRLIEAYVRRRERDRSVRDRKLAAVARRGGTRACEVCGFDFDATYGAAHADGYVEVHHVVPLYVSGPTMTGTDDLALVCANCHRMLHRHGLLTPQELREKVMQARAS